MHNQLDESTRVWGMSCHLAALALFAVPFGSILGPLIVWLIPLEFPIVGIVWGLAPLVMERNWSHIDCKHHPMLPLPHAIPHLFQATLF